MGKKLVYCSNSKFIITIVNYYLCTLPISGYMLCHKWTLLIVNTSLYVVWHGVVFVRYGIYKDAKFKFKIQFENFPQKAPKVYFMSEVYHPNVNPQSGLLDLGVDLEKDWNYGTEHLIFTVVEYVRLIFLDVRFY